MRKTFSKRNSQSNARFSYKFGFSLIELMVAVSIMGIVVGLASPSVMEALSDNRAKRATYHVLRSYQLARTEALSHNLAHTIRFTNSTALDGNTGDIQTRRGTNASCNTSDWASAFAANCATNPEFCMPGGFVRMQDYNFGTSGVTMSSLDFPAGPVDICFDGSGRGWYRVDNFATTNGLFVRFNQKPSAGVGTNEAQNVGGAFIFGFNRLDGDGNPAGVSRRLHVTLGGAAWLER